MFAPSCMASVHSVFLRGVVHGVFSQNAAFVLVLVFHDSLLAL